MEDHTPEALAAARRLRRTMSLPEVLLWNHLRGKPLGLKFRKQHPVGDFVVDFYCAEKRLAVEIDGIAHDLGDRPARDDRREAWLHAQKIDVLRLSAVDVLNDVAGAADAIVRHCATVPPPSALRAATSPSGGGFHQVS
ncbi:endonuclease domain-containing protein [Sphingomonas sp. CCH10-B3]|uniref:endonuclease domain-containing protein n=2 Tax=Sphingomonas TaxID=13687 RepID=UPI001E3CC62F|nr:endonuclease domain-containing protein [Sphingomonas sp. CCH10-B3]